jgi:hypothetical protein
MWWIPVVVFVVAVALGVMAASRWLPELAEGPVGGLAFFAVCGLIGAAVGIAGLQIYSTVREMEAASGSGPFGSKGDLLANGIDSILYQGGLITAVALIVFLLAPRSRAHSGDKPE